MNNLQLLETTRDFGPLPEMPKNKCACGANMSHRSGVIFQFFVFAILFLAAKSSRNWALPSLASRGSCEEQGDKKGHAERGPSFVAASFGLNGSNPW
jgi:hypothetical protein